MTKLYKFSEKRPKEGRYFICIIDCFMYLGIKKIDDEDCDLFYYYKIFKKDKENKYYKEKSLLASIKIGNPIIEYWFYAPDFEELNINFIVDCKSEFHSFEEGSLAPAPSDWENGEKARDWMKNAKAVGNSNFV